MSRETNHPPPAGTPNAAESRASGTADANVGRWERVASTALGAVLLARGFGKRSVSGVAATAAGAMLVHRGVTGRCRAYRELGVNTADGSALPGAESGAEATRVERAITVGAPPEDVYEFWRDPEQFAAAFGHFADVTPTNEDPVRYRWTVRGPLGWDITWETEVVEERPGEFLRWESPADATVPTEGFVRFDPAPGDQGTEVTLSVRFDPPGGALGDAVSRRLEFVPNVVAGKALRRAKSLVETGEIPTLADNPSGRGRGDLL